jgi:cytochrome c oxidase subunit 2
MLRKSLHAAMAVMLLLAPSLHSLTQVTQDAQTVQITAHRFAFVPNEISLKVNQPAVLVFQSEDVTHGMHFDDLDINATIAKGTGATVKFTPDKTGDFVGHCAVFCGTGHGNMSFTIHVVE